MKGPVRGSLVMGRYLTNSVVSDIEKLSNTDDTIYRLPNTQSNPEIKSILDKLNTGEKNVFIKHDSRLSGYRFLQDINGQPIAILKLKFRARFTRLALVRHTIPMPLFSSTVFITVVLWFLLQFLIVKRIEKLNKHIIRMGSGDHMLTNLIENVSDEVSSVADLYHKATHDPLTGLANRNLFYQAFSTYASNLSHSNKIVILYIDLDHFKRINDTLGHDVGDELLMTTARRITSSLRGNDLAARLGGDEFVVMLVDVESEQIESVTNRIFKLLNKPITFDNHEVYTTCSMGVCIYPDDGGKIDQLIKRADMALYHAKESGRNRYQFYSDSLSEAINESHQREIALQKALNKNQFRLHYQPYSIYAQRSCLTRSAYTLAASSKRINWRE